MRDYVYDTENRLKSVAKDGVLLAGFNYDDSGERIAKTAGGKTRHFVYPFHEKEGASETNYIYLNGQRVASIVNGQLKYIHADHLGSAQVVSNDSGTTLETARYEPFGDFSGAAPTKSGNYYTGQYFDKETGLYYYGARYYNPRVGQFTTADTIVSNPALSQSFNRYSYVQNNPLNYTDPTGHVAAVLTDNQLNNIGFNNSLSSAVNNYIDYLWQATADFRPAPGLSVGQFNHPKFIQYDFQDFKIDNVVQMGLFEWDWGTATITGLSGAVSSGYAGFYLGGPTGAAWGAGFGFTGGFVAGGLVGNKFAPAIGGAITGSKSGDVGGLIVGAASKSVGATVRENVNSLYGLHPLFGYVAGGAISGAISAGIAGYYAYGPIGGAGGIALGGLGGAASGFLYGAGKELLHQTK